MSIAVMAKVWQHDLHGSEQTVMLALADHSDDYGGNVYPSVALVAWKAGISVRAVQRILSKFRQLHALIIEAEATARRPTLYRINLQVLPLKAPFIGDVRCPAALRSDTIDRFRQTCYWCKEKGDALNGPDSEPWHIDRILPGTKGGKYEPDNVLLSCGPCNRKRGAKLAGVPNTDSGGDTAMAQRGATATSAESSVTVNRTTKTQAVSDEVLKQGIRLAQVFGRKKINPADWSEKEQKSFGALTKRGPLDDDDLAMLERYYGANRRKPDNICRRDLFTLLNNYQGEADRARDWCERHPAKGARTIRNGSTHGSTPAKTEQDPEREANFEAAFTEWKSAGRPLGEECDAIFRKHGALAPT